MRKEDMYREDGIQDYLKKIGKHHVLTREEEVAVFQRLEGGDESAREEIIQCNLRLVVKIALQFKGCGVPISDLIQEGNIGLLNVIDKFDWKRGFRFSTYAAFWIRQEVQAALRNQGVMIRLPIRKARLMGKIADAMRVFNAMEGRDPNVEEIADYIGVEVDKIKMMMPMREAIVSLDAERTEDGGRLIDILPHENTPSPMDRISEYQTRQAVSDALDFLSDRERKVMELRFGLRGGRALSLRKTSKLVGLSQEGVRRVEARALDKLQRPAIRARLDGLLTA